ncbi:MAG: hypothetical protein QF879_19375 [Candidatus Latescibacteria bacterium]|nr:hypothetical protein [Candidatus Latescibacterota bacterium]MDP7235917.1 hypothetical protein [Candidatus Latescibacterota bacterium]
MTARYSLPKYAHIGLAIILIAEVLLFQGNEFVATFFTAIVWTGYILLMDGLVFRLKGASLILNRPKEFLLLIPSSIILWLIFEFYNFRLDNWVYVNLPESLTVRWIGYAWAFSTILPGLFETAEWVEATGVFSSWRTKPRPFYAMVLRQSIILGLCFCIIPVLMPDHVVRYLFGFVWVGYILLFDPINYYTGQPSLFRDLEEGTPGRLVSLFAAGLICGVLWEFWNYWAYAKWVYTVPIMQDFKVFEMPLVGYLGFPAFALECFAMMTFVRWLLKVGMARG